MSLAVHAANAPDVLKLPIAAEAVPEFVCLHIYTVAESVERSTHEQVQPFDAVGRPMVPLVAVPPVPTLMVNAAVPLGVTMDGDVPKPEEMVGLVVLISRFLVAIVLK